MSSDSLYRGEQSTVIEAILAINPKAQVVCIDDKVVEWHNDTPEISEADIKAKQAELDKAYIDEKYQRDRHYIYPQIQEQLDLLYHDMVAGKGEKTGEWFKAVKKVKDDNPKPE